MNDVTSHRQRQDFEDQQNELAGRETGRRARFGVGVSRAHEIKEKNAKSVRFAMRWTGCCSTLSIVVYMKTSERV